MATEAAWLNGNNLQKEEIKKKREKKRKNGRKALTLTGLLMEGLIPPRKPDSRSPSHSLRKTSIGSTASARKLGTTFAASATSRNSAVTPASVAGSVALIP